MCPFHYQFERQWICHKVLDWTNEKCPHTETIMNDDQWSMHNYSYEYTVFTVYKLDSTFREDMLSFRPLESTYSKFRQTLSKKIGLSFRPWNLLFKFRQTYTFQEERLAPHSDIDFHSKWWILIQVFDVRYLKHSNKKT